MAIQTRKRGKIRASYRQGEFLDLPAGASDYSRAAAVILPLPFEDSVSYGGGTALGPEAIINASKQVEYYDEALDDEPALRCGIHTLSPPAVFFQDPKPDASTVLDAVADAVARHCRSGKFMVGLGGEHTISLGMVRGIARERGAFTLVHVDAHADLRDSYGGNPLSHASAIRRIAELPECEGIIQLGIRSTSREQVDFSRERRPRNGVRPFVKTHCAGDIHRDDSWRKDLARRVKGRKIYWTFDVDGLDPSIVPATGTPEPDGLTWRQLMAATRIVAESASVVLGMDCVELAPQPGLHHADFTVAKAVYRMIASFISGNGELKE